LTVRTILVLDQPTYAEGIAPGSPQFAQLRFGRSVNRSQGLTTLARWQPFQQKRPQVISILHSQPSIFASAAGSTGQPKYGRCN
jgi:hypothetical protein